MTYTFNNINFDYYPVSESVNSCSGLNQNTGIFITDVLSSPSLNFYYWISFQFSFESSGIHEIYYRASDNAIGIKKESWQLYQNNLFLDYLPLKYVQIMIVCYENVEIADLKLNMANIDKVSYFYTEHLNTSYYSKAIITSQTDFPEQNIRFGISHQNSTEHEDYKYIDLNKMTDLFNNIPQKGIKLKIELLGVSDEDYVVNNFGFVLFGENGKRISL